jgi:short-subunit dehydrogenase involved in D-alanine esterification of teichoic acids
MNLKGRTILITGGSAGIGLAFALKFIELGNEVIVTGRRQESSVEVIELMPPAVKTDLTADLPEGSLKLITTDELVKESFAALKTGAQEIRPGPAKQLAVLRRLAPDFINAQLWKASKKLVPVGAA